MTLLFLSRCLSIKLRNEVFPFPHSDVTPIANETSMFAVFWILSQTCLTRFSLLSKSGSDLDKGESKQKPFWATCRGLSFSSGKLFFLMKYDRDKTGIKSMY